MSGQKIRSKSRERSPVPTQKQTAKKEVEISDLPPEFLMASSLTPRENNSP